MSDQAAIQFVPISPVSHHADPHTSHRAAREITRSGVRKRQAEEVLALVKRHPGATSTELAAFSEFESASVLDRYQVARRLPELADPQNGGLVERGEARVCGVTGRMAITWRAKS